MKIMMTMMSMSPFGLSGGRDVKGIQPHTTTFHREFLAIHFVKVKWYLLMLQSIPEGVKMTKIRPIAPLGL
jgi:hypothetical protein